MVIVDYFECVKLEAGTTAGDNEWSREGITMRKFESMANELDIALWVPIQGTKDSLGAELVTMSQGGGSVKKFRLVILLCLLLVQWKVLNVIWQPLQFLKTVQVKQVKYLTMLSSIMVHVESVLIILTNLIWLSIMRINKTKRTTCQRSD